MEVFSLTFPVRLGALFIPDPPGWPHRATVDGVSYQVDGSMDLSNFNLGLQEVFLLLHPSLPPLSRGWEYRTFIISTPVMLMPKGFMRAEATAFP